MDCTTEWVSKIKILYISDQPVLLKHGHQLLVLLLVQVLLRKVEDVHQGLPQLPQFRPHIVAQVQGRDSLQEARHDERPLLPAEIHEDVFEDHGGAEQLVLLAQGAVDQLPDVVAKHLLPDTLVLRHQQVPQDVGAGLDAGPRVLVQGRVPLSY